MSNITTSASGSYTWVAGDTPGFSAFLIAQTGGSDNAPTAVTLQSFAAVTGGPGGLYILLAAAALLLLAVGLGWRAARQC